MSQMHLPIITTLDPKERYALASERWMRFALKYMRLGMANGAYHHARVAFMFARASQEAK